MDSSTLRAQLAAAAATLGSNFSTDVRAERALQVLTVRSRSNPDRFAEISATGYSWYALSVDGGFGAIEVDEEASDAEIVQLIDRYVSTARTYLEGRYEVRRSWLWGRRLVVSTPTGPLTLKRPLLNLARTAKASSD
jgi:hypothetical protein